MTSNEHAPKQRSPNVQGVKATSRGLITATLAATVIAGGILTFIWLPAEYGIDPTGIGNKLGLKDMGQIKNKLHLAAEADATKAQTSASTINAQTAHRLDNIEAQLSAIADKIGAKNIVGNNDQQPATQSVTSDSQNASTDGAWRDEAQYTLEPGAGFEVKLVMEEGAIAEYEWITNGLLVNHDTHGDAASDGQSISYKIGHSVDGNAGQLTAAFTGDHGWYWKNQNNVPAVITLRTRGAYTDIVFP